MSGDGLLRLVCHLSFLLQLASLPFLVSFLLVEGISCFLVKKIALLVTERLLHDLPLYFCKLHALHMLLQYGTL